MMAGHGLVQRERLEVVERPALEHVGVDPVDARLRAALRPRRRSGRSVYFGAMSAGTGSTV